MLKTLALIFTGLAVATAADLPENEFLLDTSIVYGRGQVSQIGPAIASDGADYFIVWLDYRRDITSDIFGSRLTQTGVVLDSTGIAIRVAPGWQGSTDVAFGGASYLVVWGHQQGPNPNRIHGARVSLSGAVLDTAGFAITTAPGEQMSPAVAFSGTCYLVAWYDTIGQGDICARRVSTDGRIDSLVVNISRAPGRQSEATIAPTFDGWLVAWRDQRQTGTNYAYAARRYDQPCARHRRHPAFQPADVSARTRGRGRGQLLSCRVAGQLRRRRLEHLRHASPPGRCPARQHAHYGYEFNPDGRQPGGCV
jgi:hypothetical protein